MLAAVLGLVLGALPVSAWAKEKLTWLLRDLPPLTVFKDNEPSGGAVYDMLELLKREMPDYEHQAIRVNRARALQMLQERKVLACDPTLLWTAERATFIHFSIPSMGTLSNGVVVRRDQQEQFEPYMKGGLLDLQALLASKDIKLGLVAERSYGVPIDDIVKQAPEGSLNRHHGDSAVTSLLQMQALGRLKALLGYWPEVRYLGSQQRMDMDALMFLPVRGMARYQFIHVGCSDTPQGQAVVTQVDGLLRGLRNEVLPPFYARWLDDRSRAEYLHDAVGFFTGPDRQ